MAPSNTYNFSLAILSFLIPHMLADYAPLPHISCPTITITTSKSNCPLPTPAFCPQPACILQSPIPIPCGCPTTLPTTTTYTPCPTHCFGTCGTYYTSMLASCSPTSTSMLPPYAPPPPPLLSPSPSPTTAPMTTDSYISMFLTTITTQPTYCSTITIDGGSDCWSAGCETTYSRCNTEKTVALECGCRSVPRVTSCRKQCDRGCVTSWRTGYLPCPTSPPSLVDR